MKHPCILALVVACSMPLAWAQDFRKTYPLPPGGFIQVFSPNGNIKVLGHSGKEVEVVATKTGPDRDFVEILDGSFGNRIHLSYRNLRFGRENAGVDFEIRVPQAVEFNLGPLKSASGRIEVSGVAGHVFAESVGGSIEIRDVQGLISARSISGSVRGDLKETQRQSSLRFTTISGSIAVKAPASLNARVHMTSSTGLLKTSYPIEVQEMRYGQGKMAFGKLGTGHQMVFISSISGDVSLMQK